MKTQADFLSGIHKEVFAGRRILLCEDSKLNQLVMLKLLRYAGLKVDVAENGVEGIRLAGEHPYAAVLMDLMMPVMDGIEATRRIRILYPDLPVIALTGANDAVEIQRCLDAGLTDYLAKPVKPRELFKMLAIFLSEDN